MRDRYYFDPQVAASYDAEHFGEGITTDDIPFYVDLALDAAAAGHQVLELACGTGRVTLPIAEAGVTVAGIDNSPAMLDEARRRSAGRDNPRWVQADMTAFDLAERFGLVIIPFRSFLHLLTTADQLACLRNVHAHLEAGGRLALNFFDPRHAIALTAVDTLPLDQRRHRPHRSHEHSGEPVAVSSAQAPASDGAVISRVNRDLRLRYVYREEMDRLLSETGFEVEALYGWFDRRPYISESREMVWLARRST